MRKTSKITVLAAVLVLVCSLPLRGEQFRYAKGQNIFEVVETSARYEVICRRENGGMASRNRNILDRQLRMDAVNLIGSFILFKTETTLPANLFQVYVDGIDLHYNAYVEGIRQEERTIKGEPCIVYSCGKDEYRIESATYNRNMDIPSLLNEYYSRNKGEDAAAMLYTYEGFSSGQYLMLERDFLLGDTALPQGVRVLQSMPDCFEASVYSLDDAGLKEALKALKNAVPVNNPYKQFFYEEILTASPLEAKGDTYKRWRQSLSSPRCVWEDFLLFCSGRAKGLPKSAEGVFSDVIEAYPGAISPFGVRQPVDRNSYSKAAGAYSRSEFEEAARMLRESIDNEGLSAQTLNLLGASYRFMGQADKAMPFLLLGFKLDPGSAYATGNIAICAKMTGYPRLRDLCIFLLEMARDDWSRNEIKALVD